jgi:uncharacterized 2Fe-2S/4Fe-4S cluster protein (DUF4445 family)
VKTYTVTFLPEEKSVQIAPGKTILEAALAAGVPINSICGGDGVCGKCRVIVRSGKVTAEPNEFLTRRDIQRGVALACQTYPEGDVLIEVPLESRVGAVPQLAAEDAARFAPVAQWVGEGTPYAHDPLSHKDYLQLSPPALDDSISDQERVYRELRRRRPIPIMQTGLSVLRQMPSLLRDSNWQTTVTTGQRGGTVEVLQIEPDDTSSHNYGVAVDVGTTTVNAHLVDLATSQTVGAQAKYNSQISYGEDIISRIMYANTDEKLHTLRQCVVNDINDLIAALTVETKTRLHDITYVMCAGNTTMTHLLLGLEVANIRREPYVPSSTFAPVIRAAEVGIKINARGLLGVIPSVASYVGGDLVADVLVSGMIDSDEVSILVDMGTNGELVIGNRDWLACCSASAGPAFEGGGITCGMRATQGAIEHIALEKGCQIAGCGVIGGGKPLGLCGSGLIDLVAELLRVGCIDRSGHLVAETCGARLSRNGGGSEFVVMPGAGTALGRDIIITEADIASFIRAKGAIYTAAEALLRHTGLDFSDVQHVYVAGGFGNYLDVRKAIRIGLLPDLPIERFQFIGNGSLQGAKMALLSRQALEVIEGKIAPNMTHFELSTDPQFMNEFTGALFLPHTNIEKFPSVEIEQSEVASERH